MKRLLTLFLSIIVVFLISSCTTYKPIQKHLIGTWKVMKIKQSSTPGTMAFGEKDKDNKNNHVDTITNPNNVRKLSKEELEQIAMSLSEINYNLTFNADKTAVKEYQGKTIHATWKLKDNGRSLLINSKGTGKQVLFHIQQINDTIAIFSVTSLLGTSRILYEKKK
ncbi:MAG: hypothetical protein ABSD71_00925 [Bacteroidales bacterium]